MLQCCNVVSVAAGSVAVNVWQTSDRKQPNDGQPLQSTAVFGLKGLLGVQMNVEKVDPAKLRRLFFQEYSLHHVVLLMLEVERDTSRIEKRMTFFIWPHICVSIPFAAFLHSIVIIVIFSGRVFGHIGQCELSGLESIKQLRLHSPQLCPHHWHHLHHIYT